MATKISLLALVASAVSVGSFVPPKKFLLSRPSPNTATTCYYYSTGAEPATSILVTAASTVGATLASLLLRNRGTKACLDQINAEFPGSLSNEELVRRVSEKLDSLGYTRDSIILATSMGSNEAGRDLIDKFASLYDDEYILGGLGGFPWSGVAAFEAMATKIPVNGTALLIFAPHTGVNKDGRVGTVHRRGRTAKKQPAPCCEASVAAYHHVTAAWNNVSLPLQDVLTPNDSQFIEVCNALMPYAERLDQSTEPMAELPYACYDAQKDIVGEIVKAGAGSIAKDTRVGVLGGIQINTPTGCTDYFIPLSFELFDSSGEILQTLTL